MNCQVMCLLTMLPDEELPMHMKARRDVTGNPHKVCVNSRINSYNALQERTQAQHLHHDNCRCNSLAIASSGSIFLPH
jgi:hypothetical protein